MNEDTEELLVPSQPHPLSRPHSHSHSHLLGNGKRETKYVPSPTLSYYAHFIPPTPAPAGNDSRTDRPHPPIAELTGNGTKHRIKRKNIPAPLDIQRASLGLKSRYMDRHLPQVVVVSDSPEKEVYDLPHRVQTGKKNKIPRPRSDSPDWVEVEQGHRHPSYMGGLTINPRHLLNPPVDDLPQQQQQQQRQQHYPPFSPAQELAHPLDAGHLNAITSAGALHDILLTPLSSSGTWRRHSPLLITGAEAGAEAEAEGEGGSVFSARSGGERRGLIDKQSQRERERERRKTFLQRAGKVLNDQRMRFLLPNLVDHAQSHSHSHSQSHPRSTNPNPNPLPLAAFKKGLPVGSIVPPSLTGFSKGKEGYELRPPTRGSSGSSRSRGDAFFSTVSGPSRQAGQAGQAGQTGQIGQEGREGGYRGSGYQGSLEKGPMGVSLGRRGLAEKELGRRKRRRKIWIIVGLSSLVMASIIIGVCVGILTRTRSVVDPDEQEGSDSSTRSTSSTPAPAPTSSTYTLSNCLGLFSLAAPTAPSSYPCDQCLPPLQTAPNDFLSDSGNVSGIGAVLQFCALQSIWLNTVGSSGGKRGETLQGWMGDTNPCSGWSGVGCDGKSRVNSLSLVYPAVPSTLDNTIAGLVGLEQLKIVGNSNIPSGPIPSNLFSASLMSVDIESTALTSLTTNAFASVSKLTSLVLVSNNKLGSTLPVLPETVQLSTLSVTGQSLTADPFPGLLASLTYMQVISNRGSRGGDADESVVLFSDLSYNSLSGAVPNLGKFTSLDSLFLDSNDYRSLPSAFPSTLRDLSLQTNPSLSGEFPTSLCSSTNLQTCDMRGTSLGQSNARNTTTTQVGSYVTKVGNATASTTIAATRTAVVTAAPSCGACKF